MLIITWLVVGALAGILAGILVGGYGILADIVVGMVGAIVGGMIFSYAGWHVPWGGLGGAILVAFVGAVVLLVIIHAIHSIVWRRRSLP